MRLRHILPLVALLAVPAVAQERTVMGGFQVGLVQPTGSSSGNAVSLKDAVDNAVGFDIGGHVSFNLQNGHMIRIRLDETYSSKSGVAVATVGAMGDYLYHFSGRNEGFFLVGGVGFEATAVKLDYYGYGDVTTTKSAVAWTGGLGWQFNPHVGLEVRYASSRPTGYDNAGPGTYDLNNDRILLSAGFSF